MNQSSKSSDLQMEKDDNCICEPCCRCFEREGGLLRVLFRRKLIQGDEIEKSQLSRKLNMFDLLALGVGSTLGAGIYVITGNVAMDTAGPAIVFSFLIAAIASVFAGLCYAEFGARVPRAGSAYIYSYVTVGEIWAFIIGYNLILEYLIGTAAISKAWSASFDSLFNKVIERHLLHLFPMSRPMLSTFPDLLALTIILIGTVILSCGVKESARVTNFFAVLNVCVIVFVIMCGFIKGSLKNWQINPADFNGTNYDPKIGKGGFFPWGLTGILAGAAPCFFAFAGFDTIASTGEEVKNPQKLIPIGIIGSLFISFLAYIGVSMAVTLMQPYFKLNPTAPLPMAFEYLNLSKLKYVVAAGSMFGISSSLMGCMFPLPRILYAMSSDGLLFNFLSTVNKKTQTPIYGTIASGLISGIIATFFDIRQLIDLMSMGTLLSYSLVAACVLILRYRPSYEYEIHDNDKAVVEDNKMIVFPEVIIRNNHDHYGNGMIKALKTILIPKIGGKRISSHGHSNIATYSTFLLAIASAIFCIVYVNTEKYIMLKNPISIVFLVLSGSAILILLYVIAIQPQDNVKLLFKVRLVPFIPFVSIFVNIFLMVKLNRNTWLQFAVCMIIGFAIYFFYGVPNSKQRLSLTHHKTKALQQHKEVSKLSSNFSSSRDDNDNSKEIFTQL